ncbi:hypothetical protein GN244_ATG00226 [Phytophthora infestans]|uniref:Uncharacterized protein n=1 Tax=Phytophthora infestans TaxID=4787 RepID=A0A833TCG5_PHYIN|nr:hypothetical protein GN244_ATG00226 [Phytophthora infestans]KAF4131425.1 hypothetical protein GN958_ATG19369 [Phytophthora infestans]
MWQIIFAPTTKASNSSDKIVFCFHVCTGRYIDRAMAFRGSIGDFQVLFRHLDAAKLELDTMLANNGTD